MEEPKLKDVNCLLLYRSTIVDSDNDVNASQRQRRLSPKNVGTGSRRQVKLSDVDVIYNGPKFLLKRRSTFERREDVAGADVGVKREAEVDRREEPFVVVVISGIDAQRH